MVEKYYEWFSAGKKNLEDIKKLKIQTDHFKKEVSRFLNINLNSAKQNKNNFQLQYNNIRDFKSKCDTLFLEMGRLGDAMKHYSNENKTIMDKYLYQIEQKYRQFANLISKLEVNEKMQQKKAEEREKRIK